MPSYAVRVASTREGLDMLIIRHVKDMIRSKFPTMHYILLSISNFTNMPPMCHL